MEVILERDVILNSLNHIQGIIEKKNTLPILANVLIEASGNKVKLTATDLDIIFVEEIDTEVIEEGATSTSAAILYDIVRKSPINSKIEIKLINENKLQLKSGNSKFNLKCLKSEDFPLSNEDFQVEGVTFKSDNLKKIIDKTKISISNDETRHYLSGIFFHKTQQGDKFYFNAISTDSHRLSKSSFKLENDIVFEPIILPRKIIFIISSMLENISKNVEVYNNKAKIKFEINNCSIISKVIDGKFPDYTQVIPKENVKNLEINPKDFIKSVDRVASVSSDKKEGVKMHLLKDNVKLTVNSPSSGDGTELVQASFNSDEMSISFNSKYLMDVASLMEGDKMVFNLKDTGSPAIIKDSSDPNSIFVIMPMKI